jgi:hypothetical protein
VRDRGWQSIANLPVYGCLAAHEVPVIGKPLEPGYHPHRKAWKAVARELSPHRIVCDAAAIDP